VTILVRSHQRNDDQDGLRSQVATLETALGERRVEAARARADLDSFGINYRKRVGLLHEQLDKLEIEIAEAELGELSKQIENGSGAPSGSRAAAPPEVRPRYTTDAARK
jgi:hypothetical protein